MFTINIISLLGQNGTEKKKEALLLWKLLFLDTGKNLAQKEAVTLTKAIFCPEKTF